MADKNKSPVETGGQLGSRSDLSSTTSLASTDLCKTASDEQIHVKEGKQIDEVTSFSLCSLCAIKLEYLYPENYHQPFKKQALESLVKHLNLPDKVRRTMLEFTIDDEFTFLMSIKQNNQVGLFKLIEELVRVSIEGGSYDARSHQLVIGVAEMLGVPRDLVELHCESIYDLLCDNNEKSKAKKNRKLYDTKEEGADEDNKSTATTITNTSEDINDDNDVTAATKNNDKKIRKKKTMDEATVRKVKKYMIVGLASLGGAAVMGVTGGLAAPVVASALAGVVGGSLALSTTAAGVVGSLFGVAGAGLTASKMNKRIGDLEEFSFLSMNPACDQTSLTITIAISGWISQDNERGFIKPWRRLRHTREQYCLCYEPKYLLELSQAMDYLLSLFFSYAAQQALTYTFLASVMAAIAWPAALMSMANIIDNPWDVCINRSTKAGKRLAEVLRSRQQGSRPVTLIGFSLGARVIFYCLQELAQHNDTLGLVADVIILGAPVTACEDQWRSIGSKVVSGKIINGYSSSDWLLKFLYRTSNAAIKIAGLQEIPWQDRRLRNVNLTSIVGGHLDYYKKINEILQFIGIKTADPEDLDDDLTLSLSAENADSLAPNNQDGKCPRAKWDAAFVNDNDGSVCDHLEALKLNDKSNNNDELSFMHANDTNVIGRGMVVQRQPTGNSQTVNTVANNVKVKRRVACLRRAKSLNWSSNSNGHNYARCMKTSGPGLNGLKRQLKNSWAIKRSRRHSSGWSLESI